MMLPLRNRYGTIRYGCDAFVQASPLPISHPIDSDMNSRPLFLTSVLVLTTLIPAAAQQTPTFSRNVKPVLAKFCVGCHGPKKQEGSVRLDNLNPDLINGPDAERWHQALDMINQGDMPPKDEAQPSEQQLSRLTTWMQVELRKAIKARQLSNRRVMRRLTKQQYTNTLQALLSVDVDFGDALPDDGRSKSGFSNNGSVLQTTPLHLEYYQKIAREALKQAIFTERPKSYRYRIRIGEDIAKSLKKEKQAGRFGGYVSQPIDPKHLHADALDPNGKVQWIDPESRPDPYRHVLRNLGIGMRGSNKKRYVMASEGLLMDSAVPHQERAPGAWHGPSPNLKMLIRRDFPAKGNFVFRVTAAQVAREGSAEERQAVLQVSLGNRTDDGMDSKHFDGIQKVTKPVGEFHTYAFRGRLENLPVPQVDLNEHSSLANILVLAVWNGDFVKNQKQLGSRIQVSEVEFEAPFFETWPPRSHTSIFFDSANKTKPEVYSREILQRFIGRAFRRPARTSEVDLYHSFWKDIRDEFDKFEDGIQETLVAVLSSPKFIYLAESADDVKTPAQREFELASRLSYFLWDSPPDARLSELAGKQELKKTLSKEIERMIADDRSWRFIEMFCDQWLKLYRHKEMQVDVRSHPSFTRFVKADLADETYHYMRHVLGENMSIIKLIDSDFTIINQNLAEFYGIPDVVGTDFRVVKVGPESRRGGLLTQGSFLSGHSDGKQAHPIKRAVWVMERILGESPPPPPPNVPDLDPRDSKTNKLSIAKQLAAHRDSVSCRICHKKLDPYGLVFEDFNGAGLLNRNAGKNPDTTVELPTGVTINGVAEMRSYIVKSQKDRFTRSLVEHLLAYSLGRDMSFADNEAIDRIVKNITADDYRFQSVIREVVSSPLFLQEN
jgi:hypothetical protein